LDDIKGVRTDIRLSIFLLLLLLILLLLRGLSGSLPQCDNTEPPCCVCCPLSSHVYCL